MAIAVQSTSNASNNGTSITTLLIDKPTGLALGDLMVAFLAGAGGSAATYSLSGWTAYASGTFSTIGTGVAGTVLFKEASSGDVSATDFTFTASSGQTNILGAIMRITGGHTTTPFTTSATTGNNTGNNPTFASTITPTIANSLIVQCLAGYNWTSGLSGYAIVTSNPTWTERVDLYDNSKSTKLVFAIATAPRPETTATGNSSVTATQDGTGYIGNLILALQPAIVSSSSDTVVDTDSVTKIPIKIFTDTVTDTDSESETKSKQWTNDSKNTTTWTNDTKH